MRGPFFYVHQPCTLLRFLLQMPPLLILPRCGGPRELILACLGRQVICVAPLLVAWRLGVGVGGSGKCVFFGVFFGYDTVNVVVGCHLYRSYFHFWLLFHTNRT